MNEPRSPTTDPGRQRRVWAALAVALVLTGLAYRALFDYDPTAADRELRGSDALFFSPVANHPFYVYTIAALVAFLRRDRIRAALGSGGTLLPGAFGMAASMIVCAWSSYTASTHLLIASLVLTIFSLAWWLGGKAGIRAIWLPAVVLLALIPIPPVLVDRLVYTLQIWTASMSTALLQAVGIDAVHWGDRFATRERIFVVIESCSGIRSTQTLVLTAVLLQQIFCRSRLQSALLVALSPIVGLLVNEIRVLTLVANPYSDLASVHAAQGLMMLVVGILVLAGIDVLLARALPADPPAAQTLARPIPPGRAVLVLASCALLAAASFVEASSFKEPRLDWTPVDLPLRIGDWQSRGHRVDREFLGSTTFSTDATRRFVRGDETIELFVGLSDRARRHASPLSPKLRPLGSGRVSTAPEPFPIGDDAPRATASIVRGSDGSLERVVMWREDVGSVPSEAIRELLALDRGSTRLPGTPRVVRLATSIESTADVRAADVTLRRFAQQVRDRIAALEARAQRTE